MHLRTSLRAALAAVTTAVTVLGVTAMGTTAASATPDKATAPVKAAAAGLPERVFAPYFEAWTGEDPATLSQQSGAKHLTMAFLQAATKGSCTAYWNGDTSMPISTSTFGASINKIRAAGGDVIPSFGGYTADNTGTEIADSCTNVNSIAAVFQNVINTYGVTRIDLDIEDNSLTNSAGIDRRNKAIKQVQDWAAANGKKIEFAYTLPTTTSGLADSGLAVLRNAVANNAKIDIVNIMTFDYYDNASHNMANDTKTAAQGLHDQLAQLYPNKTSDQLWRMIGVIEMIGIDDFGPAETFRVEDAAPVLNWAISKNLAYLSFWALQRDNGGCPGTGGSDSCSGIEQSTWYFSQAFAPFTSGSQNPSDDFSVAVSPASGSVNPGETATTTVNTAVTSGSAQTVNLAATGLPAGATATFTPASVTAGGSSSLKLATTSSVTPGVYPITVTGTAASGNHTATYNLTVKGTSNDDYSISLSPATGTVIAGDATTTTVNTAVTSGSAQTVNLAATGLPAGATATFTPASVTAGGSSSLKLATTSSVTPGTYTVTVTGTGASATHTATYTLTVGGANPGGTVANGDFESGSLSPWNCQSGGTVVSSPAHGGTHALQVAATNSQTGECSQTVTLTPNHSYTLKGWVQGNYAFLNVSGGATGSAWTSSGGWSQVSVPFTTGSSGTVKISVHGWYGQGNVYADDFSIS
ncbi:glycosyl hydrolase family 18 protein [Streptosporangium jomthongense]|uniref:Glycosyl hydrolase family 18 protein n=1 Tax=Streptosporangium jomthongense TaxID=1193683 RepID=A0ABV8F312_9ACTN